MFAKAGAKVIAMARRFDKLEKIEKKIENFNGSYFPFKFDVSDHDNLEKKIIEIEKKVAPVDVLINNAGITISKRIFEHSFDDWRKVMDVNLDAAWNISQTVAAKMSQRKNLPNGGASIINISSIAATKVLKYVPAYVASKAALSHLTRMMATELAGKNIRVNSIAPGFFLTDLSRDFLESERGVKMLNKIPMKRIGDLHELDGILILLASDMSSYITGSEIIVDGGLSVNT